MSERDQVIDILERAYRVAFGDLAKQHVQDSIYFKKVDYVVRCATNRAAIRLLMSCLLAKVYNPKVDPRKPYTEIGGADSFSGRTFDERYLSDFINKYTLPCNATTAFLTPALRNMDMPLTTSVEIVGRPRDVYKDTLFLLDVVAKGKVNAFDMLVDCVRVLIILRDENSKRLETLMAGLKTSRDSSHLSSEEIVGLLVQHLACKNSSRLPVLIVAAAYKCAGEFLKERVLELKAHNAADKQTKALGDVEITLINDNDVVTCYEMKAKAVVLADIHVAIEKIKLAPKLDNYIFISTESPSESVLEAAKKSYGLTGVEIAILDCVGFIKHFLHLFHRIRMIFLDEYQKLVLSEPTSAVPQALKEAFIVLRKSSEQEE